MISSDIPKSVTDAIQKGAVIPVLPLALNNIRKLDESRQRALISFYLYSGAGGRAVGVHTTQFEFEISLPEIALYDPVLQIVEEEFRDFIIKTGKTPIGIAGVIGKTNQAIAEAQLALTHGCHAIFRKPIQRHPNTTIFKTIFL